MRCLVMFVTAVCFLFLLELRGTVLYATCSNLPTQSSPHPVLQHFSPAGQDLSDVQTCFTASGHSAGLSKTGHMAGAKNRSDWKDR